MPSLDVPARIASTPAGGAAVSGRGWTWWATSASVVLGSGGLAALVASLGLGRLVGLLAQAWSVVVLGVGLELGATLLRARALHVFLRPSQRMIGFGRVAIAQAAGSAMADVTPTGALADATKLATLATRAPASAAVSAVLTYDVVALQLGAYVILAGTVAVAAWHEVPAPLATALWATAATQLAVLAAIAWVIRRGPTSIAVDALARLRVVSRARRDRWLTRVADVDARLRDLQSHRTADRAQGLALLLGGRALAWIELYALLRVVGVDPGPGLFALIVLGQLPITRLSSVIPFGLGARDAGVAGLFVLLGLPAASGAAIVLMVRARQVTSAGLGLGALSALQAADRVRARRARAALRRRVTSRSRRAPRSRARRRAA